MVAFRYAANTEAQSGILSGRGFAAKYLSITSASQKPNFLQQRHNRQAEIILGRVPVLRSAFNDGQHSVFVQCARGRRIVGKFLKPESSFVNNCLNTCFRFAAQSRTQILLDKLMLTA